MRTILSGKPVSSGVDWISVTQRPGDELDRLRELAFSMADIELHDDMYGAPWRSSGYEGFKVGSVQYGEREDGCLLRLGGVLASAHWTSAYDHSANITRLDVQVTFRLNEDPARAIHRHYKELLKHRREFKKAAAVSMLVGSDDSRTVYSGRRSSDRFGRIYDKGRESGLDQWKDCVRYEVELKGLAAKSIAAQLRNVKDQALQVALYVLNFFSARGCLLRPLFKDLAHTAIVIASQVPARLSDVERSLQWLGASVRPTVLALLERRGLPAVLRVLGLAMPESVILR